jgi:hypothetical protein
MSWTPIIGTFLGIVFVAIAATNVWRRCTDHDLRAMDKTTPA